MTNATVGTALLAPSGAPGYIAEVRPAPANTFTLSGGMRPASAEYVCCFDSHVSELIDGIAAPFIARAKAAGIPDISPEEAARRLAASRQAMADSRDAARLADEAQRQTRAAFDADAANRIPAWAKAAIVAELIEDESDIASDYFGSKRTRAVILGFSKHTRDLFPEMRAAARNFAETARLADAPEAAEHREKYSMGGGFYLKDGYRHSSGWQVSKVSLRDDNPAASLPTAEWSLAAPAAPPVALETAGGLRIEEHTHTKKGFAMFVCVMPERVERDEFERLRDAAQAMGGWYSRPWGRTPGGFAFKDRASAEAFANPAEVATPAEPAARVQPARNGAPVAAKLRALADGMADDIAHKFAERRSNTPKQQREAASARLDGFQLQRAQAGLRALADLHEAGQVPGALAGVTSKKAAMDLARAEINRSGGYYDAGHETGQPASDTDAARLFWDLVADAGKAERAAEELRRKVDALKLASIPGYFPTPAAVVDRMTDAARLPEGPCLILEPEAGSGAICEGVARAAPLAKVEAFEVNSRLREVLQMKGVALVGSDFMEAAPEPRFDRAVMNPPFENGQDIAHVRHAFQFLKPGGRLVAIMSPGPFFRQDRRAVEFREWFEALGGEREDLPAGSFKESGTGVATVLVVIDAEG
ncbi:methyltransferase [Bosea sp. WAO]|uniref:methyltransferase n=1 Tax=Bosea sp. WAO TaxID=406341 RepID=UPI0008360B4E|nr:methyltransferase [Bosea sp. WAO]